MTDKAFLEAEARYLDSLDEKHELGYETVSPERHAALLREERVLNEQDARTEKTVVCLAYTLGITVLFALGCIVYEFL